MAEGRCHKQVGHAIRSYDNEHSEVPDSKIWKHMIYAAREPRAFWATL